MTLPTAPPTITSPNCTGSAYDLRSFMRPHVRVDREIHHADDKRAVVRSRHGGINEFEIGELREPVRPGSQSDLSIRHGYAESLLVRVWVP